LQSDLFQKAQHKKPGEKRDQGGTKRGEEREKGEIKNVERENCLCEQSVSNDWESKGAGLGKRGMGPGGARASTFYTPARKKKKKGLKGTVMARAVAGTESTTAYRDKEVDQLRGHKNSGR